MAEGKICSGQGGHLSTPQLSACSPHPLLSAAHPSAPLALVEAVAVAAPHGCGKTVRPNRCVLEEVGWC